MEDLQKQQLLEILELLSEALRKTVEILRWQELGPVRQAVEEGRSSSEKKLLMKVAKEVNALAPVLAQITEATADPDLELLNQIEEEIEKEYCGSEPQHRRGKLTVSEEELRKLYLDEGLPARIIADRFQVSPATINQRLRQWGIQKRRAQLPEPAPSASQTAAPPTPAKKSEPVEDSADRLRAEEFDRRFAERLELDEQGMREAEAAFGAAEASVVGRNGK